MTARNLGIRSISVDMQGIEDGKFPDLLMESIAFIEFTNLTSSHDEKTHPLLAVHP